MQPSHHRDKIKGGKEDPTNLFYHGFLPSFHFFCFRNLYGGLKHGALKSFWWEMWLPAGTKQDPKCGCADAHPQCWPLTSRAFHGVFSSITQPFPLIVHRSASRSNGHLVPARSLFFPCESRQGRRKRPPESRRSICTTCITCAVEPAVSRTGARNFARL